MPISGSPLPFISTSMINVRKLDPRNIALSTIIDYITKRNRVRSMDRLQFPKVPTCFPKNFPLKQRLSQNDINEKRHTLASTSKKTEELESKMKEHTLPKLQPLLSAPTPTKNEQNAKKNRQKAQLSKVLLDDFRRDMKAIKNLMNPESSSKVVESENEAAEPRKGVRSRQVHIFSPFAEANCKREEDKELIVTGNRFKLASIMNMKSKFTADQHQGNPFGGNYF